MAEPTPLTQPVRPIRSAINVSGELWQSDSSGALLRDITEHLDYCEVEVNWDNEIKWSLSADIRGHDIVRAVVDWLVPILNVGWRDANGDYITVRKRLGLYIWLPSPRTDTNVLTTTEVEGFDVLYALSQLTANRMITVPPGRYCEDAAAIFLADRGDVRLRLPKTGRRTGKPRVASPSEDLLPLANEVLNAAGHTGLTPDHLGVVRSYPWPNLTNTEVSRQILSSEGDVFGESKLEPDGEAFCNQVFLRSNDPDADITMKSGYRITNTDSSSDYSVQNLGWTKTAEIADDKDLTLADIRKRARFLLERGTSMNARRTLEVMPDPRITPYEVWGVNVQQDSGTDVMRGRWYVNRATFGFTPDSATQHVTLSRLADITEVD